MAFRPKPRLTGVRAVIGAFVIALGFVGVGGALMWTTHRDRTLARDAAGFAAAEATVRESGVTTRRTGRRASSRRSTPWVVYQFEVDGRQYESDVISASPPKFVTPEEATGWLRERGMEAPGGTVVALYDPENPGRSVLTKEVGPDFGARMNTNMIGGGVATGLGGLGLAVLAIPGVRRYIRGPGR